MNNIVHMEVYIKRYQRHTEVFDPLPSQTTTLGKNALEYDVERLFGIGV